MRLFKRCSIVGLLLSAGTIAIPAMATEDSVADFYQGKRISLFIGYGPGGGYDTYGRFLARFLGRHIPGNPSIVTANRPGAGSLQLANEMYNIQPRDGTVIGMVGSGITLEPLLNPQNKSIRFNPIEFTWLGNMTVEHSFCVAWHQSKVKNFQDMRAMEMTAGATGPGSGTAIYPAIVNNVLGTRIKIITGYQGGSEILLAMERGELDGRCGLSWSSILSAHMDLLNEKKINFLLQLATERHANVPNVPSLMDVAENDKQRAVFRILFSHQNWGRAFFTTPKVPPERARALQKAFDMTMKDEAFLAEAKTQNTEISPVSGPKIEEQLSAIYATQPDIVEMARMATQLKK